jgi:hypothetical protein
MILPPSGGIPYQVSLVFSGCGLVVLMCRHLRLAQVSIWPVPVRRWGD